MPTLSIRKSAGQRSTLDLKPMRKDTRNPIQKQSVVPQTGPWPKFFNIKNYFEYYGETRVKLQWIWVNLQTHTYAHTKLHICTLVPEAIKDNTVSPVWCGAWLGSGNLRFTGGGEVLIPLWTVLRDNGSVVLIRCPLRPLMTSMIHSVSSFVAYWVGARFL